MYFYFLSLITYLTWAVHSFFLMTFPIRRQVFFIGKQVFALSALEAFRGLMKQLHVLPNVGSLGKSLVTVVALEWYFTRFDVDLNFIILAMRITFLKALKLISIDFCFNHAATSQTICTCKTKWLNSCLR